MMLTSTQIGELAAQFFIAGAGTLSFAILFGCPRKSLPFCGLVGAVGWFVYELAVLLGMDAAAASLLAVIPLTLLTRVFAIVLKMPVTVFCSPASSRWCPARASTTAPTISSRATTRWPSPTASVPLRLRWRWPWASRWC